MNAKSKNWEHNKICLLEGAFWLDEIKKAQDEMNKYLVCNPKSQAAYERIGFCRRRFIKVMEDEK